MEQGKKHPSDTHTHTHTHKTGQFEFQQRHRIDIIRALLTFQPWRSEACEARSVSSSRSTKTTVTVTRLTHCIHTSRAPLLCSVLFKLSRMCSLSHSHWKSCSAAHNTSIAATVTAGARYSISSHVGSDSEVFPPVGKFVAPWSVSFLFVLSFQVYSRREKWINVLYQLFSIYSVYIWFTWAEWTSILFVCCCDCLRQAYAWTKCCSSKLISGRGGWNVTNYTYSSTVLVFYWNITILCNFINPVHYISGPNIELFWLSFFFSFFLNFKILVKMQC